jgi:tetratricopeptide (TPR) repeat protein
MKYSVVVLFLLLFSSNLHAQGSRQRRPIDEEGSINRAPTFDDPLADIRMRLESSPLPSAPVPHNGGAVSVTQLHIPSKASKEFERSQKAFRSGDMRSSVEHIQKALQIFPDYIEAHNVLGLCFVRFGEYQKALDEHQTALSIDPRVAQTHQDLALTLLLLDRPEKSEAEAREALNLDPQSVPARYVLGRALIAQLRATPEALEMLHQSEAVFPDASLVLAQIHFTWGQTDQVIADLRHYLRAPTDTDSDNKRKAECWVAQLSQQPLPAGCPAKVTRPSFR